MKRLKVIMIMALAVTLALPLNAATSLDEDRTPLIEYSTDGFTSGRPHAPMRFRAYVEEVNGVLQLSFLGNYSDVNIAITDAEGTVVYQETNGTIYDGKVINITPADGYPYDVEITSSSINIIGVIYLE